MINKIILKLFFILYFIICIDSRIISKKQPTIYKLNDTVPVYMNNYRLDLSIYDYYKLPVPKPDKIEYKQSFFEKLSGDLKSTSLYKIDFNVKKDLNKLPYITLGKEDIKNLKQLIDKNYRIHFFIDDLPIGEYFVNNKLITESSKSDNEESSEDIINYDNTEKDHILLGYPIGFKYDGKYYLHNHLNININISKVSELKDEMIDDTLNITGTTIKPQDIEYIIQSVYVDPSSLLGGNPVELGDEDIELTFTYSIDYNTVKSIVEQRWTIYYVDSTGLEDVAIAYSIVLFGIFSVILTLIFLNIFKTKVYQQLGFEDSGWKSIYADVFRSPHNFMIFSVIVGFGVQIAVTIFILMVFSVAGLLSIANPGGFTTALMVVFAFASLFNGFASMRVYIMLGGTRKLRNGLVTIIAIPAMVLFLIFVGYFQVWSNHYVYAPSFGSVMFVLIVMWLLVAMPCSFLSSFFVRTWPPPAYPVKTNPIPRFIPHAKWYQNPYVHMLIGGIFPFIVILQELSYFLTSFVLGEHYSYSTSFTITFIVMVVIILELNMILEQYQLSLENYNWWWRSILRPATTGIYTFIYCIYFGFNNINSSGVGFYYFMFSLVFSVLMSLFCSAIGLLGNLWYLRKIYMQLKFD